MVQDIFLKMHEGRNKKFSKHLQIISCISSFITFIDNDNGLPSYFIEIIYRRY